MPDVNCLLGRYSCGGARSLIGVTASWPGAMPIRRPVAPAVPSGWVVGGIAAGVLIGAAAVYRLDVAVVAVVLTSCVIGALLVRHASAVLHLLVVVLFAESLSVGPLRLGRLLAIGVVLALAIRLVVTSWRPRALPTWSWVPGALFVT